MSSKNVQWQSHRYPLYAEMPKLGIPGSFALWELPQFFE
jgi:hypothetical protein